MTTATPVKPAAATAATQPDYAAIKQRQQATWASGDFAIVGTTLQIVGESLAEAADIRAGERVLDVAAGNGNATLAAARRGAAVISTDYVPHLLDKGRARAEAEGLEVRFEVADAEALPYEAARFDAVLSTYGVMFAPNHAEAAGEMLRVVRPGGRIGMANWTPEGMIGRLLRTVGKHVAPPAGVQSPVLWGTEAHVASLFGSRAKDIRIERRMFNFRYRNVAHFIQVMRDYYGPTHKAFGALDAAGRAMLEQDMAALFKEHDIGGARGFVGASEYMEIVVTVA